MFELPEPDDHVGDLHARVVDVVLHFDWNTPEPLDAYEGVPKRAISQMADVCGLVRIDRGVLDDRLARDRASLSADAMGERGARPPHECDAIQVNIQISVRGGFYPADAFNRSERRRQFLRDRARGLSQTASELERDGSREVAELALGRILDRQWRQLVMGNPIQMAEHGQQASPQAFLKWKNHEG